MQGYSTGSTHEVPLVAGLGDNKIALGCTENKVVICASTQYGKHAHHRELAVTKLQCSYLV